LEKKGKEDEDKPRQEKKASFLSVNIPEKDFLQFLLERKVVLGRGYLPGKENQKVPPYPFARWGKPRSRDFPLPSQEKKDK